MRSPDIKSSASTYHRCIRSTYISVFLTLTLVALGAAGSKAASETFDFFESMYINYSSDSSTDKNKKEATQLIEERVIPKISTYTQIYFAVALVFGIVFFMRDQSRKKEFDENKEKLLEAINSMPPVNVMEKFQNIMNIISRQDADLAMMMKDNAPGHEIENFKTECIVTCLDSINTIAKQFHNSHSSERFASNIMMLFETKLIASNKELIAPLLKFTEYESPEELVSVSEYSLGLISTYSSSSDGKELEIDNELNHQVLLPILDDVKTPQLPGAVVAFLDRSGYDLIKDTSSSFSNINSPGLPPRVKNALHYYFNYEQGKYIRSVLSIRLSNTLDDEACGVLNIHSDRTEIFAKEDLRQMFIKLISPITLKLYELIKD